MNKQEKRVAVKDIIGKAIEISQDSEADMFVNYAPHVNAIVVSFHGKGWAKSVNPDWEARVYLDEDGGVSSMTDYKNDKAYQITLEELLVLVEQLHTKIIGTKKEIFTEVKAAFRANDTVKAMELVAEKTQEFSNRFISEITPFAELDLPFIIMSLELIAAAFRTNDSEAGLIADELKPVIGTQAIFLKTKK